MIETVTLIAQTGATAFLAGWLTSGLKDNLQTGGEPACKKGGR